jgi:hypothetical protein
MIASAVTLDIATAVEIKLNSDIVHTASAAKRCSILAAITDLYPLLFGGRAPR